jgi:hypothetical protein
MILSKNFYFDCVLPRIIYIPYFFLKAFLWPVYILSSLRYLVHTRPIDSMICIEAGAKGWESIEFKEMFQSAAEYFGVEHTVKLIINPEKKYINQVREFLKHSSPTHYLHDPRSVSGGIFSRVIQSFLLAVILLSRRITPVVILADISLRAQRLQGAIVSSMTGVAICFMSIRESGQMFPHDRLIGPCLMPFSVETFNNLKVISAAKPVSISCGALFVGAMYEPRKAILEGIKSGLEIRGYSLDIKGRLPGEKRVDDTEYWERLSFADIVVTTTQQGFQRETPSGRKIQDGADRVNVTQLIYRFLETLASGSLLVASDVPGVNRYFTPWEHFVPFNSVQEAVERISYFHVNELERLKIASAGQKRAEALIKSRCFWVQIDSSLQRNSIF